LDAFIVVSVFVLCITYAFLEYYFLLLNKTQLEDHLLKKKNKKTPPKPVAKAQSLHSPFLLGYSSLHKASLYFSFRFNPYFVLHFS